MIKNKYAAYGLFVILFLVFWNILDAIVQKMWSSPFILIGMETCLVMFVTGTEVLEVALQKLCNLFLRLFCI